MQSEKEYFYHCNDFEHIPGFWYSILKICRCINGNRNLRSITIVFFQKRWQKTFEYKIKSFTIEQKQFNKLILCKWSVVQLIIYNINGIINTTMK